MTALADELEWMREANCRNMDTSLFFPESNSQYLAFTKEVCNECPVQNPCQWYANKNKETDGMYAGMTPNERLEWRRKNKVTLGQSESDWRKR